MKNELGAKWRRGWICSTDQWSGILAYPTHQRKRGNEGGGGEREREKATHEKIEEKTGDERSIVISEEKSKLIEKVLDIGLCGPEPVLLS